MIPADHWHDNGNGTAWWVVRKCPEPRAQQSAHGHQPMCHIGYQILDRPCDTCGVVPGTVYRSGPGHSGYQPCPDCIDGRHTFEIEVDRHALPMRDGIHIGRDITLRVSVVPGMVLPILSMTQACSDEPNPPQFVIPGGAYGNDVAVGVPDAEHETIITLPPAAAPGMWAVLVKVGEAK